jgi:hypothetical protein
MSFLLSSERISQKGFHVSLLTDPPGLVEVPGLENTRVSIHVGPPVQISCRRAGLSHNGTSVPGDIHIIPVDTPSTWEIKSKDTYLTLSSSRSSHASSVGRLTQSTSRDAERNQLISDNAQERLQFSAGGEWPRGST